MAVKRKGASGSVRKRSGKPHKKGRPAGRSGANTLHGELRKHTLDLLKSEGAHAGFEAAIGDFPAELRGVKPADVPYSAWQLLEHMRIAQWDILEFSRNPNHVSPKWPDGYWPETVSPPTATAWEESAKVFRRDLAAMEKLVSDVSTDLFGRIPHGQGQTILREALLVADHNAYHLGQLILMRRLLGAWKG
jgi:hypothetical protein